MNAWRNVAALLGRLIGLRTQKSEVSVTVEGKWKGWFDPVRLTLTALVVAMALTMAICVACGNIEDRIFNDEGTRDPVTEGPYQCCP